MTGPELLSLAVLFWWLALGLTMASLGGSYLSRLFLMDPDPDEYPRYLVYAALALVAIVFGIALSLDTGERLIVFINSL